jgi:Leucine-rich repeat (LRR) protein
MNKLLLFIIFVLLIGAGAVLLFRLSSQTQVGPIPQTEKEEKEIRELTKRTSINLAYRGLLQVPESIFRSTDIEVLDLSYNELNGALPAEIRHLQNLKVLNLSYNNFTGVPAEVGQLSELVILDLAHNPITGIPHEIGNLQNLQVLDLRGTTYHQFDLNIIREKLPKSTQIMTD